MAVGDRISGWVAATGQPMVNAEAGLDLFDVSAPALRAAIAAIPLDRLLLETDGPYLAPVPHRGQRNEPGFVRHVAERIALVRGLPVDELIHLTGENARRVFQLTRS